MYRGWTKDATKERCTDDDGHVDVDGWRTVVVTGGWAMSTHGGTTTHGRRMTMDGWTGDDQWQD